MQKLGIVGCGITAAVTAMLLRERMPHLNIIILEKSRGTGGRMCTSRSSLGSSVDLGAQFITKTPSLSNTQERCYNHLLEAGLLKPLSSDIKGLKSSSLLDHFICPQGSGSLVKYFLKLAGCEVLFGHRVSKICSSNNKWEAHCDNGTTQEFDAVVLTLPVPQILQLEGIISQIQSDIVQELKAVEYCSRYALGFFYDRNYDFFKDITWSAQFLSDDTICFCSLDVHKRGATGLPSVVFHSTKEFGRANVDENPEGIQDLLVHRIKKLFPEMPIPSQIKFHKWRYSQVEKKFSGTSAVLSQKPILISGGDGFSNSSFQGCVLSAESIVQNISKHQEF